MFNEARGRSLGESHLNQQPTTAQSVVFHLGAWVQIYLASTILLFAFGPCNWQVENSLQVYGYVALAHLAIAIGMFFGGSQPITAEAPTRHSYALLGWCVMLAFLIAPLQIVTRNFSGVGVLEAMSDPALAYSSAAGELRDYFVLSLVSTVSAPLRCLLVPLSITCWEGATLWLKAGCVLAIALELGVSLISGQAFGVFDVMLLMVLTSYLNKRAGGRAARSRQAATGRQSAPWVYRLLASLLSGVAVLAAISYFTYSRMARFGENIPRESLNWAPSIMGVRLPESIEFGTYYLVRYLTIGYYGLAGCLDLPFRWTYGLGHSAFLRRYAGLFNPEWEWTFLDTYPARLEQATGYSTANYWHTSYPWLASDLTYSGVLLLVCGVGYLFSRAAKDFLVSRNIFALSACSQLFLVLMYLPASCERVNRPESAFALYGSLILWWFSGQKK